MSAVHTSARAALEAMAADSPQVSIFGAAGVRPQAIVDVVKELPVYADRRFQANGATEEFLRRLPLMGRADLRRNFPHGFVRPGAQFAQMVSGKKVEVVRTSGTSSDRLQLLWDIDWWERQEMAAMRTNPVMAPHLNELYREVVLTTPLCSESVCKTGPATMEERRVDNLLFLNTQHDPSRWNTSDLARMAEEIYAFGADAIEADPVYLAAFARYMRDSGKPAPKLKWIVLTYELVSAIDKASIGAVFGCPVFEFYGLTEAGVFFMECPKGRHHFCGTDAIVEVLRPDISALPAETGEVIVTTWGNTSTPLLRYRTQDLVTVDRNSCACGAPGPVIRSFDGRTRDLLEFPDGRVFMPRQIDDVLFGTTGLAQYVCVQERPDAVRVDYVQDGPADPGEDIHSKLSELWKTIDVSVRSVPFVTPEPSGKYRTVVPH